MDAKALELIPGTLQWYVNQALLFQNGYDLVWSDTLEKYIYPDTTSQDAIDSKIITQAAAIESSGQVFIKVAKGEIGSLTELSTSEKASFEQYLEEIKFAGTNTEVISETADDLKLAITIYYDPLVVEIETGTPDRARLISNTSTYPVETAITNYIQQIPFNSALRLMDLVDAIQAASGVNNVVIDNADARYGAVPYTDITAETNESYIARAGYLAMATNFGLDGYYDYPTNTVPTLTYISS